MFRYILESSYVPIENLKFGRVSYKGMNPEIETIMLEVRGIGILFFNIKRSLNFMGLNLYKHFTMG